MLTRIPFGMYVKENQVEDLNMKRFFLVAAFFSNLGVGMASQHQFVTATYKVTVENQKEFIEVLKKAEEVMRSEGLITASKAYRMSSIAEPQLILEIYEWTDKTSFEKAQENMNVLEQWKKLASLWIDGGFGLSNFPESAMSWAQFKSIQ
jgi:hypothetical protein